MMLPTKLHEVVTNYLQTKFGEGCKINTTSSISGGSINEALKLTTSCGEFFLKYNLADKYPSMFDAELKGIEILAKTHTVKVPKIFVSGVSEPYSYLLMEYEQPAQHTNDYWELFAKQLARLHELKNNLFGLDHDNYIGSLVQSNKTSNDLIYFLITQRFEPLIHIARDNRLFTASDIHYFESVFNKLENLIPYEEPTLIHGDLWSGNLIVNKQGQPVLIDPAVYYGHREWDIAMTKLFGGFPEKFYSVYNDYNPLIKGWEQRIEINQLYPLLVHVILFGETYVSQVRYIIKKY